MGHKKLHKQFQLTDDGFVWKGECLGFDSIRHLAFAWIRTTQRSNFVKVGEPEEAQLLITLNDGRRVFLRIDEQTILFGLNVDRKEDIQGLKDLYLHLLSTSFEYRMEHYLRELRDKGYFTYDECRFCPEERTIYFRRRAFPVGTCNFLKGNGYVEIKEKEMTFLDKVKRELLSWKVPQFNTQTDPDVIFLLLDRLFGLRWNT